MKTSEIREMQLMNDLFDEDYECCNTSDFESDIPSLVKRMNRQEKKRRKTCREYPDTLRVNAIRHAIEYMDGLSIRRRAPEKILAKYMSGGYAADMV